MVKISSNFVNSVNVSLKISVALHPCRFRTRVCEYLDVILISRAVVPC